MPSWEQFNNEVETVSLHAQIKNLKAKVDSLLHKQSILLQYRTTIHAFLDSPSYDIATEVEKLERKIRRLDKKLFKKE